MMNLKGKSQEEKAQWIGLPVTAVVRVFNVSMHNI
jgi:hypothetical protein